MDPTTPTPESQGNTFTPLRSYDKLDVAISMMLDNELSMDSAFALAFDSDRLTPDERSQLEDRLLKGEKGNTATQTALGIVTNPLTWIYLATGGPGANLATKGAGLFSRKLIQGSVKKSGGLLATMDLLSASQLLHDYPAVKAALRKMISGIKDLQDEYIAGTGAYAERVAKSTGLYRGVSEHAYPRGSVEYEKAKLINAAIYARSAGYHVDRVETGLSTSVSYYKRDRIEVSPGVYKWSDNPIKMDKDEWVKLKDAQKDAENKHKRAVKEHRFDDPYYNWQSEHDLFDKADGIRSTKEEHAGWLDPKKIEEVFNEFDGLEEWYWANQNQQRRRMIRLFGLDESSVSWTKNSKMKTETIRVGKDQIEMEIPVFEVDEDKIRVMVAGLSDDKFWSGSTAIGDPRGLRGDLEGLAMMEKVFGTDAIRNLQKFGADAEQELIANFKALAEPMNDHFYIPRQLKKSIGFDARGQAKGNGEYIREWQPEFDTPIQSGGTIKSTEGVIVPRTEQVVLHSKEDIEYLWDKFGYKSGEGQYLLDTNPLALDQKRLLLDRATQAERAAINSGSPFTVLDIDGAKSWDLFFKETGETWAVHVQEAGLGLKEMLANESNLMTDGQKNPYADNVGARISDAPSFNRDPDSRMGDEMRYRTAGQMFGGDTTGALTSKVARTRVVDVLQAALKVVPDQSIVDKVKTTILPAITRRGVDNKHLIGLGQFQLAKDAMASLAQTAPMQWLKNNSDWGYRFQQQMELFGSEHFKGFGGSGIASGLAKYLYGTHLGYNLGSITLNMLQPFLLTGTALGFKNTVPAYADAARELGNYAKLRAERYGMKAFIKPEQRAELIKEAFEFAEESGITADMMEQLDTFMINRTPHTKGPIEKWAVDFALKGFEKSEWFARSVTAHAVKRQFQDAARKGAKRQVVRRVIDELDDRPYYRKVDVDIAEDIAQKSDFYLDTVRDAVENFNFVPDELGTVMAFLPTGTNSFMGRVMSNPLMRQFLSFGLRSFTGTVHTLPKLGGGTRTLFNGLGPEISNPYAVLANDLFRGMGMSAIVYETGKGLVGADLSRSLFGGTLIDVGGVERMVQGDGGVPLPPAGDIPVQFMRAFMQQDMALMARTLGRTVPGGVSLSRLMGIAPDLGPAGILQRTTVGWDEPLEDGSVPVYDAQGGRLISYQRPQDLILKGLGVDLGKGQIAGDADRYLLKNRDEILQYRRRYGELLIQGETARAQRVAKQFERRFGIPLTITEQQINQILKSKAVPRTERILDTIDKAVRPEYGRFIAGTQPFNVDDKHLMESGSTSRSRDPFREVPTRLNEEQMRAIQAQILSSQNDQGGSGGFEGFSGF